MKNLLKLAVVSLGLLSTVISCKNDKKVEDAVVEEVAEIGLPNESDIHFEEAITALESNDHTNAAMHLNKGIEALKKEGKELTGKPKETLDKSVTLLKTIEKALKNNKKIDVDNLQEAMANAELAIGHEYLISDEIYLLTPSNKVDDKAVVDAFIRNLRNLEKTTEKLKKDSDELGHILLKEGKDLEKQYKDWKTKVEDHVKRTNEHFKESHPKYHYPMSFPL